MNPESRSYIVGRDTNFYYSFLVLPAEKRHAIVAVWDFCRAVDDTVDNLPVGEGLHTRGGRQSPTEALARWRRELAACYGRGVPENRRGARAADIHPAVQPATPGVR